MAGRIRRNKYAKRVSRGERSSRLLVKMAVVVLFILVCLTVSVCIGIALGKRAEGYDETSAFDIGVDEYYSGDKKVKKVDAREYQWGFGVEYEMSKGITDFSVCLRDADGFITYNSQVDVSIGEEADRGSRAISDAVDIVHKDGGSLCGYIYIASFAEEDEYLRGVCKAYELALIREAALGGVDEIMLVGIDVEKCDLDELIRFVSDASIAAGDAPLGVLVNSDCFETSGDERYSVASKLSLVCDFLALDLRNLSKSNLDDKESDEESKLEAVFEQMDVHIRTFDLRLVFSKDGKSLLDLARKMGAESTQIIE